MSAKSDANKYLSKLFMLAFSDDCFTPFDDFNHLVQNVETVTGYKMQESDFSDEMLQNIKHWLCK